MNKMKNFLFLLVVLTLLLVGCRKTNDVDCLANWNRLGLCAYDDSAACNNIVKSAAMQLLNEKQIPNTVGEYAQKCLQEGYRPPGMGK
jgi:hypothetical protein